MEALLLESYFCAIVLYNVNGSIAHILSSVIGKFKQCLAPSHVLFQH